MDTGTPTWPRRLLHAGGAACLLTLAELVWSWLLGLESGPAALLVMLGSCVVLVVACELLAGGALASARRVWPARPALVLVALAAPLAWLTSTALFSGAWVSSQPWAGAARLLTLAGLLAVVPVAHAVRPDGGRRSPVAALTWLLVVATCSWADNTVLVGQYPALHLGLALGALLAARWCVTGLGGSGRVGPLGALVAGVVVLLLAAAPLWAVSATADRLAYYTHGLVPKLRQALVLTRQGLTRSDADRAPRPALAAAADHGPLAGELLAEFVAAPTPGATVARLRAATRNVVVVLLDAVRDDHVGPRDGAPSLTPFLDELVDGGALRLPITYAPSDHTGRSVPSILTGLPLPVIEQLAEVGVRPEPLLETLARQGWATFCNGSAYVESKFAHLGLGAGLGAERRGEPDGKADGLVDELLAFVEDTPGPFAVYSHWSHAHVPRREDMAASYATQVRRCDDDLRRLVTGLAARGSWDDTLLVVTADHGYGLGEQFQYLGAHGCGDLSLRVPLILRVPGGPPRLPDPPMVTSNLALVPTLHDLLLGGAGPPTMEPSLLGLLGDPGAARLAGGTAYASTGSSEMVRRGAHKLTVRPGLGTSIVFDLAGDPGERAPLDDDAVRAELAELLVLRQRRADRLAQGLVLRARRDVDPQLLEVLAESLPESAALEAQFARYDALDDASRSYLVDELLRRGLRTLDPALVRAGQAPADLDDQRLLLACWLGDGPATTALAARLPRLADPQLERLAVLWPELDESLQAQLVPALLAEVQRRAATGPAPLGPDGRLLALSAPALLPLVEGRARDTLKDLLVTLFNRWSADEELPAFFIAAGGHRVSRRDLLDPFLRHGEPTDVARFERLARTREFAQRAPELVRRLDSQEAREWLAGVVADWRGVDEEQPGDHLVSMVSVLRRIDDAAYLARLDALIQARFPGHPRLP